MSWQAAGIIETVASREGIDLRYASLNEQLYVYALTFLEMQNILEEDIYDFPEDSLKEIAETLNSISKIFNKLLKQKVKPLMRSEILSARVYLNGAISSANSAKFWLRSHIADSEEFYRYYPDYQSHLLKCRDCIVDINNEIAAWLQPE